MNVSTLLNSPFVWAHIQAGNARHALSKRIHANHGLTLMLLGLLLILLPMGAAEAQTTLSGAMTGWTTTLKDIVAFVMNIAVVVGVLAIMYGIKLVIDKSNDRENVKNGHIVVSFVGGAMMCMLWFVVRMMTGTVGSEGNIGKSGWN